MESATKKNYLTQLFWNSVDNWKTKIESDTLNCKICFTYLKLQLHTNLRILYNSKIERKIIIYLYTVASSFISAILRQVRTSQFSIKFEFYSHWCVCLNWYQSTRCSAILRQVQHNLQISFSLCWKHFDSRYFEDNSPDEQRNRLLQRLRRISGDNSQCLEGMRCQPNALNPPIASNLYSI